MKNAIGSALVCMLLAGCGGESGTEQTGARGTWKPGKADGSATCVGHCGGSGAGGCWCDDSCEEWGDCCPDYVVACDGPPAVPTCNVACQYADECPKNEPYCNQSTGKCQQEPPQCVTDQDCSGDQELCHPSGYCYIVPPANCRPGYTWFEGACDQPSCEASVCPPGTAFEEATCSCLPTVSAPACTWGDECIPAYPYCNQSTGMCQQEPPQCVTSQDCGGDEPYCHRSGYCYMVPDANCRPGWGFFEGACDSPGCPEEATCPPSSVLDPQTCYCVPVCG